MSKKKSRKGNSRDADQRPQDKLAAKKAAVLEGEKRKRWPGVLAIIVCGSLVVLYGLWFFSKQWGGASTIASAHETRYPLSLFDDGRARHFEYRAEDGILIKYFVIKSSDGVVRAAFDACDVCWRAGKGYYQQGDDMVCRNCGQRFASIKVNEVRGGCNPAPLTRRIVDGKLVIESNDILEGSQFFDFSGRI